MKARFISIAFVITLAWVGLVVRYVDSFDDGMIHGRIQSQTAIIDENQCFPSVYLNGETKLITFFFRLGEYLEASVRDFYPTLYGQRYGPTSWKEVLSIKEYCRPPLAGMEPVPLFHTNRTDA